MSDTRFTATTGWYVEGGFVRFPGGAYWLDTQNPTQKPGAVTLIEYGAHKALAERDAALGRWRSVEHPDVVSYPRDSNDNGDHALLVDETTGVNVFIRRTLDGIVWAGGIGFWRKVAAEYWAAHPEPKPWEQAKPHEVWVLTFLSGLECAATYVNGKFRYGTGSEMVMENVIAGKCIWKRGVSE